MPLANRAPIKEFTPGAFVYGFTAGDDFDSRFSAYDIINTISSSQQLLVNSYKFADGNTEGVDEFSSGCFTIVKEQGFEVIEGQLIESDQTEIAEIRLNTLNLLEQNNSETLINFINSGDRAILFRNGRGQNIGYFFVEEAVLVEEEITVEDEILEISYLKILISSTEFVSVFENEEIYTFSLGYMAKDIKYVNENLVPETQGGFFAGEPATPPEGLTFQEFNNKFLFPEVRPSISFTANNLTLERGTDYTQQITINFTQGGAGNLISYSLEKDGAEISTTQVTQFEQNNVRANFTLQGKVSHEAGVTISAGTISTQSVTIRQRLRIWFAPLSSVPNTSTDVRGMSSNAFDNANSLNLNTGTTNKTFVVAVPTEVTNAASLSAQDVTNNVPYTYNFIRTVDVVLPDNITEEYRVYALVVDNAYSLAANHIIQI
jgi:hypothetical protein